MVTDRSYFLFLQILLFLLSVQSFSQELAPPTLKLPITIGVQHDALKLVKKLTEGRESDKDKFDAIFTWVAQNIRYDYATYLAPRGTAAPKLKRILKTQRGICIDYAYLMDTLCQIAGIQNVSVYGYVKDDLFDVDDSLYIDNHAWNAVKLDNYWYVYDVTWSAGKYTLEFRRFGKWIEKLQKKLFKIKPKSYTFKPWRGRYDCEKNKSKFTVTYNTLSFWRFVLIRILGRIPLKIRWVSDKKMCPDFYLVNPEVLATTHFPDDPKWSLTANYPGIRAFEVDPKFYDLDDSVYKKQERASRHCGECDSWFALDDLGKEKQMKSNTFKFNPRNHFAAFNADFNIANIFYKRSFDLNDSTGKIQYIDSALTYYDMARDKLRKASQDVSTENKLLRAKNAKKMKLLLDENRTYQSFMQGVFATTNQSTAAMKKFIERTRVSELRGNSARDKLKKVHAKTNPYNNKDIVLKMQDAYIKKKDIVDSVSDFIAVSRVPYSDMLQRLAKNLYSKDSVQDSLVYPFIYGGFYRHYYLLDNYKKKIVEERKKIPPMKELYVADMNNTIYLLSDSVASLGMRIFKAFEKRDQYILESGKLLNVLTNEGMVGKDSLKQYIKNYDEVLKENLCWLTTGSSQLKAVIEGYKRMYLKQKYMVEIVRWENRIEGNRYKAINQQISWRKKKFGSIPTHNLRVCAANKTIVAKTKKAYLKKLKDERRKEKEEAKKKKTI
jgi:hypothetical protein